MWWDSYHDNKYVEKAVLNIPKEGMREAKFYQLPITDDLYFNVTSFLGGICVGFFQMYTHIQGFPLKTVNSF